MAMTREQRRKMFGIAGELIRTGRSSGRIAGRSAQVIEGMLETGNLGGKTDAVLRTASIGMLGYRWAAEQAAANLSFGMRIATTRDPFTAARLQSECLAQSWQRWWRYTTGLSQALPPANGKSA